MADDLGSRNPQDILNLAKAIAAVVEVSGKLRSAKEAELDDLKKLQKEQKKGVEVLTDAILVQGRYVGDIRTHNKQVEELSKTLKQVDTYLKEANRSELERSAILSELSRELKKNADTSLLLKEAWEKFRKGGSLQEFFKDLSKGEITLRGAASALKSLIGPLAILAATSKLLNVNQAQKGYASDILGATGNPNRPGLLFTANAAVPEQKAITRMELFGKVLGMTTEETLSYSRSMVKQGFVTGKAEGAIGGLTEATIASLAVQRRFGAEASDVNGVMHSMRYQLGYSSSQLGGAMVNLASDVKGTSLSVPEYFGMVNEAMGTVGRYGKNLDSTRRFLGAFSDQLKTGAISVGDYTRSFTGIRGASTGQLAGFSVLAERYAGIKLGNIRPGMGALDRAAEARSYAEGNPTEAIRAALLTALGISRSTGVGRKAGLEMATQMMGGLVPGIEGFAGTPTKDLDRLFNWAQNPDRYGKGVEGLINKYTEDQSKKLYNDTASMAINTSSILSVLERASAGEAFKVMNLTEVERQKRDADAQSGTNAAAKSRYLGWAGRSAADGAASVTPPDPFTAGVDQVTVPITLMIDGDVISKKVIKTIMSRSQKR